jgi:HD superfamily phosphohydrolase YqeK
MMPAWAIVTDKRRAHIARVAELIEQWAIALQLPERDRTAWHDAALWHDALRDAPDSVLRTITGDTKTDASLLHGPAAADRLAADGERRADVLSAVRWHTTGSSNWEMTGRALYMADFLEPGRTFAGPERAYLAHQVPTDFAGTFRQVVRLRLEWAIRDGKGLATETIGLWNAVR